MDPLEKLAEKTREKKKLRRIFLVASVLLGILFYEVKSDSVLLQPTAPLMAYAILCLVLDFLIFPIKHLAESDLAPGEKSIIKVSGQTGSMLLDYIEHEYVLTDRRLIVRTIFGVDWYDIKDIQKIDAPKGQILSFEKNVKIVFRKDSPSEKKLHEFSNRFDQFFFGDAFSIRQNEAESFYNNLQQAVAKAKK